MDIPIQNIYYMLCYAWNKLEERDIVSVDQTDKDDIEDLFARVLVVGISHLLKKGLDRGYVVHKEETSLFRGKIDFTITLKRSFFKQPQIYCEYDELSYNVLHNQILKSTVLLLMHFDNLSEDNRQQLRGIYRRLAGVDCIEVSKKSFRLVQLHSNNYFYDFLLCICELIYDNLSPSEEKGRYKFRDFTREKGMSALFEEFVRNFYKRELKGVKVGRERINWDETSGDEESRKVLPVMETDISLTFERRKIIIDTKYYKEAMNTRMGAEKLISDNLYQLFAYLINSEAKGGLNEKCEGILLYPLVSNEHNYEYLIKGHRMAVKTINLNQDWQEIHQDLLNIII